MTFLTPSFSMLVAESGRVFVSGGPKPPTWALYRYNRKQVRMSGRIYAVGHLVVDYGALTTPQVVSNGQSRLYFQKADSGFYAATEVDPAGSGAHRGAFIFTD